MQVLSLILLDNLKEILIFPLWWYASGFLMVLKWAGRQIIAFENTVGFMIWLTNIFTPMYGQSDFWGRLISFFVRIIQILFRGIILLIYVAVILALVIGWLIAPPFIVYMIYWQIF